MSSAPIHVRYFLDEFVKRYQRSEDGIGRRFHADIDSVLHLTFVSPTFALEGLAEEFAMEYYAGVLLAVAHHHEEVAFAGLLPIPDRPAQGWTRFLA